MPKTQTLHEALEARGYEFHSATPVNSHWWTLTREGWDGIEVGDRFPTLALAQASAAVHAMDEADAFMRCVARDCVELGLADEDADVNGADAVDVLTALLLTIGDARPDIHAAATVAVPEVPEAWAPGPMGRAYYLDAEGYLACVPMDRLGNPDWSADRERVADWQSPMSDPEAEEIKQRITEAEAWTA